MIQHGRKAMVLAVGLLSACATAMQPEVGGEPRRIEIQGHRGSRGTHPENTLPAFEEALRSGAEVLEFDLGVTRDQVLVIYHDQKINPVICKGPARFTLRTPLRQLSFGQLKRYDCGSLRNPRFPEQELIPGTTVPTLDEFFQWLKKSPHPMAATVKFNIEMKSQESEPKLAPPPAEFAALLISSLRKHGMLERTIIQSFDFRTLREARKLAPEAVLSALIEDRPSGSLVEAVQSAGAQVASPNHEWLTAEDVAALHAAGIQVAPWTANDALAWNRLAAMKVDAIITDYPRKALAWRQALPK